ncbi:MAG TPA: hypothetical protein DDY88_05080 [Actinobacteria bacterium]|nr:hypothetical protein [Actinomycetota bacterium]
MTGPLSRPLAWWAPFIAGLSCSWWAFLGWLTVIPNQDMLSDAIQVQSVIHAPRVVLAFPGQKHAGTIEYPLQILAELAAPSNFYAHTAPRIALAFLTGFVTVKLFQTLMPKARLWALLIAIAVGPAIMHGLSGPEGNAVGVWWLVGNYDMSWLLVTTGAWVLARFLRAAPLQQQTIARVWLSLGGAGLLVGLGFFAHPNITLLILPLATLVLVLLPIRIWQVAVLGIGFVVGAAPAAVSYVVNADITTWDPSHPPFVAASVYLNVLGLNGVPDYLTTVLPSALGLPTTHDLFSGTTQSVLCWVFVIAMSLSSLVGIVRAIVKRSRLTIGAALALSWCASFAAMILFATFVDPVWFYATSLSILLWIWIGALPEVLPWKQIGTVAAIAAIALMAVSMVSQSWYFYKQPISRMQDKRDYLRNIQQTAQQLEGAGARIIYGSYYDVVPIGYGSDYGLRTITNTYDRIPLTKEELAAGPYTVAVNEHPTHEWAADSLENVRKNCTALDRHVVAPMGEFGLYDCPAQALVSS